MNDNLKDETAKPILIHMQLHTVKWRPRTDRKGEELSRAAYPKVDAARDNRGALLRGPGVRGQQERAEGKDDSRAKSRDSPPECVLPYISAVDA